MSCIIVSRLRTKILLLRMKIIFRKWKRGWMVGTLRIVKMMSKTCLNDDFILSVIKLESNL